MREQSRTSSPTTQVTRAVLVSLLLAMPLTADAAHSIAADEGFVPRPTCRTTGSGPFNSPGIWSCGRVPTGSDWAQIDHAITLSSNITVWTLYISQAGSLTNAGTGFTITISDTAPADAPQFDTGIIVEGSLALTGTQKTAWARTPAIAAGATSLTVDACDGWQIGDRLVVGDTREQYSDTQEHVPEVRAIAGLAGCAVTLASPLGHAYTTARDHAGEVERLIPVGNLTRDITIRSANPAGRRGHLMLTGMASADLRYVSIVDMGRTTLAPLDPVINHIGRYALHMHHLMNKGAASVVGTVVERSTKWGYTVHASNGNTLRENLAYDTKGWGFGTEDSSETDNVFDRNLSIYSLGTGAGGSTETAIRGTGFWLQGPRNILTGNVSVNAQEDGFALYETGSPRRAVNTFKDNEAIANNVGITLWGVGDGTTTSVIEHFMEWQNSQQGLYGYGSQNFEFRDFYSRSDPSYSQARGTRAFSTYNWFGDYDAVATTFTRPNIQNKDRGIYLPYGTASSQIGNDGERLTRVVDGYFYNDVDLLVRPLSGSAPFSKPMRYEIVRPKHGNATGVHYDKHYEGAGGDIVKTYRLVVTDYQGVPGDSFEVYADAQAPGFPMPQAGADSGCPVAGLTNQQCHDAHGVSIFGDLMPATATSRPFVVGKVAPVRNAARSTVAPPRNPASSTARSSPSKTTPSPTRPVPVATPAATTSPTPHSDSDVPSQADYSSFPICAQVGTDLAVAGHRWTIEPAPSFKVLRDGVWGQQRGLGLFVGPDGALGVVTAVGRLARLQNAEDLYSWTQTFVPLFGCRLPTSANGSTVLQENGYLVDHLGGVWIASCAYEIPATFCPNFAGTTIEPGILVRNGARLGSGTTYKGQLVPMGGLQSMPEPNNAPWNLCWSGGEMYVHVGKMEVDGALVDNIQTHATTYARWLGIDRYDWAPATESDCRSGTPATTLGPNPPSNVRIVRDN